MIFRYLTPDTVQRTNSILKRAVWFRRKWARTTTAAIIAIIKKDDLQLFIKIKRKKIIT